MIFGIRNGEEGDSRTSYQRGSQISPLSSGVHESLSIQSPGPTHNFCSREDEVTAHSFSSLRPIARSSRVRARSILIARARRQTAHACVRARQLWRRDHFVFVRIRACDSPSPHLPGWARRVRRVAALLAALVARDEEWRRGTRIRTCRTSRRAWTTPGTRRACRRCRPPRPRPRPPRPLRPPRPPPLPPPPLPRLPPPPSRAA